MWPTKSIQFGGKFYTFEGSEVVRDWNVCVAPEPTFNIIGVQLELPPQKVGNRRASQFRAEAMSLLVDRAYYPAKPWSQPGGEQTDSDDEVAPDEPIPPALEGGELLFFNRDHKRLHTLFHQAREVSFSNAYAKNFVERFCEILVLPTHQVLISANTGGRFQPGSMILEWVVGEDVQPAGERANKNPRRGLGDEEWVADVVILSGELVTTMFEVKTDKGGVSQNKEQMAGLFRDGQSTILGIVVEPAGFHINLFVADPQERIIRHHILRDIPLEKDVEEGLTKLAELIIYFNNMVTTSS